MRLTITLLPFWASLVSWLPVPNMARGLHPRSHPGARLGWAVPHERAGVWGAGPGLRTEVRRGLACGLLLQRPG